MKTNIWPDDADGDVFRRLDAKDFDFSKTYVIDFNIDFDSWPPPPEVIQAVREVFHDAELHKEDDGGYILFKVRSKLTYEIVINTQIKANDIVSRYGGRCESWGILH